MRLIRPMRADDAGAVLQIYQEGCDTGHASFANGASDWAAWHKAHLPQCRLIAETGQVIEGWAALSPVSARAVYRGVAEVSLYIAEAARRHGAGQALLAALIKQAESDGFLDFAGVDFSRKQSQHGVV